MGSSAEHPIEVDHFLGIGAHICSNLGVAVSEAALHKMYSNYKPPSDVVGLQIGTGSKSLGGDMSDLTAEVGAAAAAAISSTETADGNTVSNTAAQNSTSQATLSNTAALSSTTVSNQLPVSTSAALSVAQHLTTETNQIAASTSAAHFTMQTSNMASTLLLMGAPV